MKKWKWNWGSALALSLALFAGGMVYVMVTASSQNFDLVTRDYYAAELAYQEKIDQRERALALGEPCEIEITPEGVMLNFPEALEGKKANLRVHMYSPVEADLDFVIEEENWAVANFELPFEKLSRGKWIAKIDLESEGKRYYFEPELTMP